MAIQFALAQVREQRQHHEALNRRRRTGENPEQLPGLRLSLALHPKGTSSEKKIAKTRIREWKVGGGRMREARGEE